MTRVFLVLAAALAPSLALADGASDCDAIYKRLEAEAPGDMSKCEPVVREPRFEQCKAPQQYAGERPASHVVLVLDASGSMAGKVDGETKMAVAKREALKFLSDLEDDVPVGLMVYGHRGNNEESGKAESCAATEWAHKIGTHRGKLADSINTLEPTGWTPLGGVLTYAQGELGTLRKKKGDKVSVPVLYIISDGEETCGGDPVAAAKSLHESGVRAAVNVIGFDVDDETRAQLEAISEAGGGRYFPAEDSNALQRQLAAVRDTQNSLARYNYCILLNRGSAAGVYHSATGEMVACYHRESSKKRFDLIKRQAKEMVARGEIDQECADRIWRSAFRYQIEDGKLLNKWAKSLRADEVKAIDKAYADSIFSAFEE